MTRLNIVARIAGLVVSALLGVAIWLGVAGLLNLQRGRGFFYNAFFNVLMGVTIPNVLLIGQKLNEPGRERSKLVTAVSLALFLVGAFYLTYYLTHLHYP